MAESEIHILKQHQDSVLCCGIDNKSTMIVSAGVDDTAFVWNIQTREVRFECSGHKESVVCCGFNSDSSLIATADMSGLVQVRETNSGEVVSTYDVDEVQWLTWHNISPKVLLVGTKTGEFWMWNVEDSGSCKVFPSFNTPTTNGRLLDNGQQILVSYADGSLRTLNLKTQEVVRTFKDVDHNPEIVCLDLSPDGRYIALGCLDSKVKIISHPTFKLLKILTCSTPPDEKKKIVDKENERIREDRERDMINDTLEDDEQQQQHQENDQAPDAPVDHEPLEVEDEFSGQNEVQDDEAEDGDDDDDEGSYEESITTQDLSEAVEAICFSREADYLVAANTCGSIYLWQVSNQSERAQIHLDAGVSRAVWTLQNQCILACLDGTVRIFDCNLKCVDMIDIHQEQILDLVYKDGLIVTGSDDHTLALFNYPRTDSK